MSRYLSCLTAALTVGSPAFAGTFTVDLNPPANPVVFNEQRNGGVGVDWQEPPDLNDEDTETRVVAQSFTLPNDTTLDAIGLQLRTAATFTDTAPHDFLIAILEDTDSNGIGDTQVGGTSSFDFTNQALNASDYLTFNLDASLSLTAGTTYHFEMFWGTEDPEHLLSFQRSGNNNGAYEDGGFFNVLDDPTFPAGELLTVPVNGPLRDMTFYLLGTETGGNDPADLDLDGDVDDADFALFFAAFSGPGVPTGNPAADLDGDTDTDDADFGLAFAAFTGPGGAASVPEPAGPALVCLGGLVLLCRRRA